jgi:GNAT superfamily N-acetyltransferase
MVMGSTRATADAATSSWTVREVERPETHDQALALLAQLRPGTADLVGAVAATVAQQVRYLGAHDRTGRLVGLAGWRIVASTRGRVLYVDDLVTDQACRSQGAGGALLAWLERTARTDGCQALELDSGVTRDGAHRFYARAGLSISAFHFAKTIPSDGGQATGEGS